MIKTIIIALLAIAATKQSCDVGCLKCNNTGDCLVPDLLNSYYLNGIDAVKVTLTNCALNDIDGECVLCSSGYYLDNTTDKCVANPTSGIDNCSYYSSSTSCGICKKDFYLSNNACVAVTTAISNCEAYSSDSTCYYCADTYLLSLDTQSCVSKPSISNCGTYTFVKCNTCDSGYVLYPNNYLDSILNSDTDSEKGDLALFTYSFSDSNSENVAQNACQTESTENCELFDEGTNTCTTCSTGYYLDSTTSDCVVYPDEPIENCQTYTDKDTCTVCVSGYYFNNGVCTQITGTDLIANCSTYKGDIDTTTVQCSTCDSNYYLSSNTCQLRSISANNSIANCATKDPNADECSACSTGYILATDYKYCFAAIANCKTYQSTNTNETLKCSTCNSEYYLVNESDGSTTCTKGSVSGCDEYPNDTPGTCNVCLNQYVLSSNVCTLQTTISQCVTYSQSESKTCLTCTNPGYFNFYLEKYCQNIPAGSLIDNCATYTGDLTSLSCDTCNDTFYKKNGACITTGITNCLELDDSGKCISCKTGYAVALDGASCITALNFVTDNCLTNSTSDSANSEFAADAECNVCQNGAIPFDQKDYYVCISYTEALEYNSAAPTSSSTGLTNCIKFDSNFNCVQCNVDSSTPYLQTSDNTCVASCTEGSYKKYIYDQVDATDTNTVNILQLNICYDGGVTGCEEYAPNLDTADGTFICVKCQSTYLNILSITETAYTNANPFVTSSNSFFPSAFAKFPQVTCGLQSSVTTLAGVSVSSVYSISNCTYYIEHAANEYSCLRCEMGFVGTVNANNMISACTRNTDCSTERYYNLDIAINNITSCHKCNTSGIPFIAYEASTARATDFLNFAKYSLTLSGTFANSSGLTSNMACRANASSTFTGLSAYDVPSNCGLAVIIINSDGTFADTADATTSSYGIFCAACAPGYMPTALTNRSTDHPYVATACTKIDNCATTGTYFNACSACNSGYVLSYSNSDIDFTTCLTIPTETSSYFDNCLAASAITDTTNAGTCEVCKTGYFLNDDSVCEKYAPVNCSTNGFIPVQKKSSTSTLDWSLALNGTTIGCNKCSSGIAYQMTSSKVTCMESTWISNSVDSQSSSNYIRYCKNYEIDTSLSSNRKCKTCNNSYVMSGNLNSGSPVEDGVSCFTNASIENCAIAQDATTCIKCADETYSLVSNNCVLGNIDNCIAYNYETSNSNALCVDCASNYYLDTTNNSCILGQVHNCKRLSDDNAQLCDECEDGYVNVSVNNSNDYCYPKSSSLGCDSMTISNDSTYGGRIYCDTCTNNGTQAIGSAPASSNQTLCMAHYLIDNCSTYDIDTTINASTFKCTECNSGFYLSESTNRCVARTNVPSKCTIYDATGDLCDTCDDTSYLKLDGTMCVDYPQGILGCLTYSNATTCTSCDEGRYLNSNACPRVTTAIDNCLYYSANGTCSLCGDGYALVSNTCKVALASNCETYTSDSVCKTCPSGYGLETTNNVTSCVAVIKVGCSVIDINSPYNCLTCSSGYYLESGACNTPTNTISNCTDYDSATTCSLCDKGYALSVDKTSCDNTSHVITYIDSECVDSQITSTAVCSRCGAGFYFVDGACTGTCNSGSSSGCLACNPKSATTCYVCKSGYYQTEDGTCNAPSQPSSVTLIKGIFTVLVVLAALMF